MFSRRLGIRPRPFLRRLTGRRHFGANFGIYGLQLSQMDMLYFQLPSSHSGRGGRSKTVQPPILKHALRPPTPAVTTSMLGKVSWSRGDLTVIVTFLLAECAPSTA